ncbi:hypothetical protein [Nocardioides sp. Root151]|uniref:hypothetical protein n=1 Tax=Nocardioides sp. Root151 TaxID=1736475 RepID=UPI0007025155|nr:hypothetical protein [Nocardioides sp. Root151]KQZ76124.1 hypothetical protein ASD66_07570 [Nocardioides sp. Root151]
MSPKRVILHVGTPKTGTSYLQDVLFSNRDHLAGQGVLYPADRFDGHFLAALDLMRLPWGGLETQAVGAWDRLAAQVREWPGTAIISHEILATADRTQIRRALETLGHPDTEIHVVLSVRDLVRQIPAEWQENIKHRRTISYRRFLAQVQDPDRAGRIATWFWGVQEIPDILNRWGAELDPSRVHVVTVPKPGAPKTLLWERFAEAFDLGGLDLDLHVERANPSLGVPETALIRRINKTSNADVEPSAYRPLVRELLAHQTLSRRAESPRLALPPDVWTWADELSHAWVDELRARRYDVVGDLDDLIPDRNPVEFSDPDRPRHREVNAAALDAIHALLLEGARMRQVEADLRDELRDTQIALERAYLRPTYRAREKIVRSAEDKGWGRRMLGLYRRVRGRSSRPA